MDANTKMPKSAQIEKKPKKRKNGTKDLKTNRREGKPLLFGTVQELQKKVNAYFESCYRPLINTKTNEIITDSQGNEILEQFRPFTISGLAYALHTNRQTLINYQNRDEYFDTITRAKERCENFTEEQLFNKNAVQGAKFVLINGYKEWAEKQVIDQNVNPAGQIDVSKLTNDDLAQLSNMLKRIQGEKEPEKVPAEKSESAKTD